MNVSDYLIDQEGHHWGELLTPWSHLTPTSYTIWFVNRFGDLIIISDDGSVHYLEVATEMIEKIADDLEHFYKLLEEPDNYNDWFMVPLVDELVAQGVELKEKECYFFEIAPTLGGNYQANNVKTSELEQAYSFYASIHEKTRDFPDGTKVIINFTD
jgi:hypothetical protein